MHVGKQDTNIPTYMYVDELVCRVPTHLPHDPVVHSSVQFLVMLRILSGHVLGHF